MVAAAGEGDWGPGAVDSSTDNDSTETSGQNELTFGARLLRQRGLVSKARRVRCVQHQRTQSYCLGGRAGWMCAGFSLLLISFAPHI